MRRAIGLPTSNEYYASTNLIRPCDHSCKMDSAGTEGRRNSRAIVRFLMSTCVAVIGSVYIAPPANADELSDLRKQMKLMRAASIAMERRLERLERERRPRLAASDKVITVSGNSGPGLGSSRYPGFIDVPGTSTSVKIGGYIKVDGVYDVRGGGIGGTATDFREINLSGTPAANRAGDINFTARESQFNLTTLTPTSWGDLKTYLETDFYGAPNGNGILTNSYTPRLRQAYAAFNSFLGGSWLVGETWSTFMDFPSYPETLDLGGPVGLVYIRQPMLRYTRDLGGGSNLALAMEAGYADFEGANPYPVYTAGGAPSTNVINPIPDFVSKYSYDGAWGHVAIAGIARYIKANTGGDVVNNFKGQAGVLGGGGMLGVSLKTFGKDTVTLQAVGGPGIGRYLYGDDDSGGSAASLVYCGNTGIACSLRATTAYGGVLGYQHFWLDQLRSTVAVGYAHYDDEFPDNPSEAVRDIVSLHANLIWEPLANTDIGLEYIFGSLAVDASPGPGIAATGHASRLMGSTKVAF